MSEKLYVYVPRDAQPEDERTLMLWYPQGEAPQEVEGDGITWELRADKPRDSTQAFKCIREGFRAISLPRWWPFAKRHAKDGTCVFDSETEAIEACKRARDAGEPVAWDR